MKKNKPKTFSFSTVENFDAHIANQIRTYDVLDATLKRMARLFIEDDTNVYDLGCSTGRLVRELRKLYPEKRAHYYGVERNINFAKDFKNDEQVHFLPIDLREGIAIHNASLVLSVFTLQFIAPPKRAAILKQVYDGLNLGGGFVWAEKVISENSKVQNILTFQHFDMKREKYTGDEILQDEEDLRDTMKPVTLSENEAMLRAAGFTTFEVFWRYNNFLALVAIK